MAWLPDFAKGKAHVIPHRGVRAGDRFRCGGLARRRPVADRYLSGMAGSLLSVLLAGSTTMPTESKAVTPKDGLGTRISEHDVEGTAGAAGLGSSKELHVILHVVRVQYLTDQHQSEDDVTYRGSLGCVNDSRMLGAFGV